MNVALWIGQGFLAAIFTLSGVMKSTQSLERMIETGQTAAKITPLVYMRIAGVSELLGVLGVILPWATGIVRVLTPIAALGFGIIMILAATIHSRLREPKAITANMFLLALAVTVAWGRFADL